MEIRGGKKGEGLAGNWIHARTHGRGTSLRDHRVAHSSSPGDHISSCTDYCKRGEVALTRQAIPPTHYILLVPLPAGFQPSSSSLSAYPTA